MAAYLAAFIPVGDADFTPIYIVTFCLQLEFAIWMGLLVYFSKECFILLLHYTFFITIIFQNLQYLHAMITKR